MAVHEVVLMFRGRWDRLLASADALSDPALRGDRLEACLAHLDTVLEVFPKGIDPVEDEQGFAVRAFARALRAQLAALRGPARGKPDRKARP